MPRALTAPAGAPCSLEEAREALCARGFDPRDEASLHHAAGWLARLGRNRDFLGDLLVERLSTRGDEDAGAGGYGPQAIMLSGTQAGHFLRANIWPAAGDHACRTSGRHSFVYDLPHDHNFDFLTVGYFGPGYRSDYYEYDHAALAGWRGERAGLRFVERSALSPGRLLHYRAHRDVHRQLPPASLSVSLNLVAADPAAAWFDQYAFDLEGDRIDRVLNPGASEAFLHLAVGLGSGEAVELARWIGHGHPSDRLRLASFAARAASAGSAEGAERVWREAEGAGSRLVRAEAARRRAAVAAG